MIVIFDVDGVLFDTSKSYHLAILETIKFFTGKIDINKEEILEIKFRLGINNDWDVSVAGIIYTLGNFKLEEFLDKFKDYSQSTDNIYRFGEKQRLKLPKYKDLIDFFEKVYSDLRESEEMIVKREDLKEIRKLADTMGVITGRPFDDLDYSFKKFNLYPFFDYIITDNDTPKPYQRKPSSYPLKLFFKKFQYREPVFYIGDTIADRDMVKNFNTEEKKKTKFIFMENPHNKISEGVDFKVKDGKELVKLLKEKKKEEITQS